jgi:hypothetical protein
MTKYTIEINEGDRTIAAYEDTDLIASDEYGLGADAFEEAMRRIWGFIMRAAIWER